MRQGVLAAMVWVATILAATSAALAQDAPEAQPADPDNAATWYRLAYEKYQAVEYDQKKWEPIWAFEQDPDRAPAAETRAYLRRYKPALDMLRRATRRDHCDFGIPNDPDSEQPLPQLSHMRALIKLLDDDYLLRVLDGDTDGAIDCLSEMSRMSGHLAPANIVMSSLVGSAMISLTCSQVDHALDRAIVGPAEANRLLREIKRFKGDDPMHYREAITGNRAAYVDGPQKKFSGAGGLDRFKEDWGPYFRDSRPELVPALEALTQEQLNATLANLDVIHDRVIGALHEQDIDKAQAAITAVQDDIKSRKYGVFADEMIGWLASGAFKQMLATRKQLDDLRTTLQGIADGTVDPMLLANAAPWYIRAALQWEALDQQARDGIDAYAAHHEKPADDALRDVLQREDVRKIIRTLQTATTIERCDFKDVGTYWASAFASYHAGLLGCGRLLIADATGLLHDKDADGAAARLATAYRLSSRLAGDGRLGGALAAHRIFDDAESLVVPAMQDEALSPASVALLAKRVREFSRGDAFHYQPAVAALREGAKQFIIYYLEGSPARPPNKPDPKLADDAAAIVNSCGDDRAVTVALMCEAEGAERNEMMRRDLQSREGLQSIFDLQAMQDAIDKAHLLREWAKDGVLGGLASADLPRIAPLERRMKEAEQSFRACIERFDRASPEPPK